MNHYKLTHVYTNTITGKEGTRVSMEFEEDLLPEVLEEMETFLLACGYKFKGRLAIVEDDE